MSLICKSIRDEKQQLRHLATEDFSERGAIWREVDDSHIRATATLRVLRNVGRLDEDATAVFREAKEVAILYQRGNRYKMVTIRK